MTIPAPIPPAPHRPVRPLLAVVALALLVAAGLLWRARESAPPPRGFDAATARRVIASYADLMLAVYTDVGEQASALEQRVAAFVEAPSEDGLTACRSAWLAVRPFYIESEVGRFYDGPVDGGPNAPERFLNAWPLDEAYIDGVAGDPRAGLINAPLALPTIDRATLRDANEAGGEANIATGWHAIEFLLWGQDRELGPGGGQRSYLDFVPGGGTAANERRRGEYLRAVAGMLVEDLAYLRDQWAPGDPNNYRTWFLASTERKSLGKILSGIATLAFGELRGERLAVPFVTKDRENEHSCFSDSTHLDHLHDVIGIRNVWEGRYASSSGRHDFSGTGLRTLARETDARISDAVDDLLADLTETLGSPALVPFETAILGVDTDPGRETIGRAMKSLAALTHGLFDLAHRMDVPLNTQLVQQR